MYYGFPEYCSFQPTFIFFTPILPQQSYLPASFVNYEITDLQKMTSFAENASNSYQNNSSIQGQVLYNEVNVSKSLKAQRTLSKKQVLKETNNFTEVHVKASEAQNLYTKKKKVTGQLFFGMEWKNQNRNIVPNIMNQMLSFIQKKHKSEHLVNKLFRNNPHREEWTISRYYCYIKRMKSSLGHYVNENNLTTLTQIQQPQYLIYSSDQQQFYLKICRITIDYFFRTESIFISLTSKRMSHEKRKAHLIARRALLRRFEEILHEYLL